MINCVASESTLMSRPVGQTRTEPLTPENTACPPTRWFQRCSGPSAQELTSPRTSTIPGEQTPLSDRDAPFGGCAPSNTGWAPRPGLP